MRRWRILNGLIFFIIVLWCTQRLLIFNGRFKYLLEVLKVSSWVNGSCAPRYREIKGINQWRILLQEFCLYHIIRLSFFCISSWPNFRQLLNDIRCDLQEGRLKVRYLGLQVQDYIWLRLISWRSRLNRGQRYLIRREVQRLKDLLLLFLELV